MLRDTEAHKRASYLRTTGFALPNNRLVFYAGENFPCFSQKKFRERDFQGKSPNSELGQPMGRWGEGGQGGYHLETALHRNGMKSGGSVRRSARSPSAVDR